MTPDAYVAFDFDSTEIVPLEIVDFGSRYVLQSATLFGRLCVRAQYMRKDLIHATRVRSDQEQNRNRQGTKLDIEKAREIRSRCSEGNIRQLQHSLAREYGVSASTIRDIHFNRKWKEM